MKNPQIISTLGVLADQVILIWGQDVIKDTDQTVITTGPITVDINFWNLTEDTASAVTGVTMTYQSTIKSWTIPVASIEPALEDQRKFFALVAESGTSTGMREFYINEFVVDNLYSESALMKLPYAVNCSEGKMIWYPTKSDLQNNTNRVMTAEIYEGGTGVVPATDPSRVTHRGPLVIL